MQDDDCQIVNSPVGNVGPSHDGENLMMRITLLKVPQHKEPPQRKTLFKTICKAHGKICKVIVDSSSTKNLVSVEMVEKLKLKKLPHANPYKG